MFANQKIYISQNNPNISTKSQNINISNHKEKNLSLFSKKINLEHREFGNDLTNIALTVFEKSNIISNKPMLKAIELIKANIKNKERSREKSLIKDKNQNVLKNSKNKLKDIKKRQTWKMAHGEVEPGKKLKEEEVI